MEGYDGGVLNLVIGLFVVLLIAASVYTLFMAGFIIVLGVLGLLVVALLPGFCLGVAEVFREERKAEQSKPSA